MPTLKLINKKRYARVRLIRLDSIDLEKKECDASNDSTEMATCPEASEGKKIDLNMTDETADITTCSTPTRKDTDRNLTETSTRSNPTEKEIDSSLTEETACYTPSPPKQNNRSLTELHTCPTPTRKDIDPSLTEETACSTPKKENDGSLVDSNICPTPTKKDIDPSLMEETTCSTPSSKKQNNRSMTESNTYLTPMKEDIGPRLTEETTCSTPSPKKQNDDDLTPVSRCSTPPRTTTREVTFPSFFVRSPARKDRDCDIMFHIANNDIDSQFEVVLFSENESENMKIEKDIESFLKSTEITPQDPPKESINLSKNTGHEKVTELYDLGNNSLLGEESTVYSDASSVDSIASIEYLLNFCGCKDDIDLDLPPNEILLTDE